MFFIVFRGTQLLVNISGKRTQESKRRHTQGGGGGGAKILILTNV